MHSPLTSPGDQCRVAYHRIFAIVCALAALVSIAAATGAEPTPDLTTLRDLSIEEIMQIIPHRPPFLLVDRILEIDDKHAVGVKQVTINEPFFAGHFPGNPIMPGVLQVEALAQVGAVAVLRQPAYQGKVALFARIENVRFRRPVVPGDTLMLEVQLTQMRSTVGKGHGIARVDNEITVEGDFTFALIDPPRSETSQAETTA